MGMYIVRWLGRWAGTGLWVAVLAPALALVPAAVLDRGAGGRSGRRCFRWRWRRWILFSGIAPKQCDGSPLRHARIPGAGDRPCPGRRSLAVLGSARSGRFVACAAGGAAAVRRHRAAAAGGRVAGVRLAGVGPAGRLDRLGVGRPGKRRPAGRRGHGRGPETDRFGLGGRRAGWRDRPTGGPGGN